MHLEDMRVGQWVRLTQDCDVFDLGIYRAGETGEVTGVDHGEGGMGEPVAYVRFDRHFPELRHWDNELQVFRDEDRVSSVVPEAFETIDPGGQP